MNEPLVSIVIPIYNIEKYIQKCINSILRQTYSNLEIILVDDESPDNCPGICDQYNNNDKRIKVIHKKNGGLSDARNAGLEIAKGNYIIFIDGDDYVEPDLVATAVQMAETNNLDVVIWGFFSDFVDENEELVKSIIRSNPQGIYSKSQLSDIEINSSFIGNLGYAWNKLYSVNFLKGNNFKFTKGLSLIEDIIFNSPVLSICERIGFIEEPLLHYMQRPRITLGTKFYNNYFDLKTEALIAVKELLDAWGCNDVKIKKTISSIGFDAIKSTIIMMSTVKDLSENQKKDELKRILSSQRVRGILGNVELTSYKDKIIYILLRFKLISPLFVVYKKLRKENT